MRTATLITLVLVIGGWANCSVAQNTTPAGSGPATLNEIPSFGWAVARMLLVLGTMLLSLYAGVRWLSHRNALAPGSRRGRLLRVVESRPLDGRKCVYLIQVGTQFYLLGGSENGLDRLAGPPLSQDMLTETLGRRLESSSSASSPGFLELLRHGRKAGSAVAVEATASNH